MKTSLALVVVVAVLLLSDSIIRGTGALECYKGNKCKGKDCPKPKEGEKEEEMKKGVKCDTESECGKVTAKPEGKDAVYSFHGCLDNKDCDKAKDKAVAIFAVFAGVKIEADCHTCKKDNCNAAPKSTAQGLGFVMMAATLTSSVFHLGMM